MATRSEPSNSENVYFNDPENVAEMARLLGQDRLITKGMGGLFSERFDLSGIHRILDVACGPGGWALEVALTYPEIEVVGVDLFQPFIVKMGVATQEEVNQLYEQMQLEMRKDDLRGLMLPLTAWGEKS